MESIAGPALLALLYAVGAYALGVMVIDALNLRSWRTDDEWQETSLYGDDFEDGE